MDNHEVKKFLNIIYEYIDKLENKNLITLDEAREMEEKLDEIHTFLLDHGLMEDYE